MPSEKIHILAQARRRQSLSKDATYDEGGRICLKRNQIKAEQWELLVRKLALEDTVWREKAQIIWSVGFYDKQLMNEN